MLYNYINDTLMNTMDFNKKINEWYPYYLLHSTECDRMNIINYIKNIGWSKYEFHKYFKEVEELLLFNIQSMINSCDNSHEEKSHEENVKIRKFWYTMELHWKVLALLRDFHDYMCGRDKKHNIRTDDCHRFIRGIRIGLSTKKFIKPVCRILCGESSPRKFTHPLFIQFNYLNI
jgi:hypothetical protein